MPPCYELGKNSGMHLQSPLRENAIVDMLQKGIGQQPTVEYISIGVDAGRGLYSKKELEAVVNTVIDSPPIRFIIPCLENWASQDAATILYAEKEGKRAVHIIFLQLTLNQDYKIYAKGLNQVRDAIPEKWKSGEGEGVAVHYYYILVLLT